MPDKKHIALVAHDQKKKELLDWVSQHQTLLAKHQLYATGSTGGLIEKKLGLTINKLESGPLGGDQQIGAMIAEGKINLLIFFWDPLESQPHDPDVRALLRIAVVWNIPIACNISTANIIITSDFMEKKFHPTHPDYSEYRQRKL